MSNNFWGSAVCVATALDMHGEYLGSAAYVQIDGEHSFGSCGGAERDVGYSMVSVTRAAGFSLATRSLGDALSMGRDRGRCRYLRPLPLLAGRCRYLGGRRSRHWRSSDSGCALTMATKRRAGTRERIRYQEKNHDGPH